MLLSKQIKFILFHSNMFHDSKDIWRFLQRKDLFSSVLGISFSDKKIYLLRQVKKTNDGQISEQVKPIKK